MDLRIEWMEIFMALGAAVGGLLTVIIFIITASDLSLWLFAICLLGGAFLGFFIDKVLCRNR
jgi:hypothetical protein